MKLREHWIFGGFGRVSVKGAVKIDVKIWLLVLMSESRIFTDLADDTDYVASVDFLCFIGFATLSKNVLHSDTENVVKKKGQRKCPESVLLMIGKVSQSR